MAKKLDVNSISDDEFDNLEKQMAERRTRREAIKSTRAEVDKLLADKGLTLADVVCPADLGIEWKRSNSLKGVAAPILYQDPENPEHTWSGRGQYPNWLKTRIKAVHEVELSGDKAKDKELLELFKVDKAA